MGPMKLTQAEQNPAAPGQELPIRRHQMTGGDLDFVPRLFAIACSALAPKGSERVGFRSSA